MLISLKSKRNYNFYNKSLKNDCYLIFNLLYNNLKYSKLMPCFDKLSLNLNIKGAHGGFNKDDFKKDIISAFSFLEALTGKKAYGVAARRPFLKEGIRKGDPLGAKRTLSEFNNYFLLKGVQSFLNVNKLHELNKFYYNLSLRIKDLFLFKNMNQKYEFFYDQKHLDINAKFKGSNKSDVIYYLQRFFIY